MKLSEILKDWPEKKDVPDCDIHKIITSTYFNKAIDACDREIDREALICALTRYVLNTYTYPMKKSIDSFISTMPQWLKRIENGKISS